MSKIIGITGSIASGKSTVTAYLTEKGYTVLDCDQISRDLSKPHQPGWREIRDCFGEAFFSGDALDRRALGAYVFASQEALAKLNAIMHPLIKGYLLTEIEAHRGEERIFIDGAVLIEAGFYTLCDELWLICAPDEVRLQRLMTRDGLDRETALNRMRAQMSQEEKKQFATHIITNEGSTEQLYRAVNCLLGEEFG